MLIWNGFMSCIHQFEQSMNLIQRDLFYQNYHICLQISIIFIYCRHWFYELTSTKHILSLDEKSQYSILYILILLYFLQLSIQLLMTRTIREMRRNGLIASTLYLLKKKIRKDTTQKPTEEPKHQANIKPSQKVKKLHLTLQDAEAKVKKIQDEIQTEEVKNSKTKRKRLYHQLAQLNKAIQNPFEYLVDPENQKRKIEKDKKQRLQKKLKKAEERKKKEKNQERHKKRCLHCGAKDHMLSECPKTQSGFCYKCGSNEHTHTECVKDKFSYASCFVCNQKGHISRECPKNEKGLYRKGGSCFGCGSVRHTLKQCPKRHSGKFIDQKQEF